MLFKDVAASILIKHNGELGDNGKGLFHYNYVIMSLKYTKYAY